MKKRLVRCLAASLVATMALSFVGCGTKESTIGDENTPATADAPIEITYATFMVGAHASAAAETEVIEAFNKQYEGKIKVVVEELPSDDAFVDKMKTLASSKSLPDVVIGKNGIRELAIENGQAVDLKPFLDADAEWAKYVARALWITTQSMARFTQSLTRDRYSDTSTTRRCSRRLVLHLLRHGMSSCQTMRSLRLLVLHHLHL